MRKLLEILLLPLRGLGRGGVPSAKPQAKGGQAGRIFSLMESSGIIFLLVLALIWGVCVSLLVFPSSLSEDSTLVSGQVSQVTFFTDFDFDYMDQNATEQARREASSKAPLVFRLDDGTIGETSKVLKDFVSELRRRGDLPENKKYTVIAGSHASEIVGALTEDEFQAVSMIVQSDDKARSFFDNAEVVISSGIMPDPAENAAPPEPYGVVRLVDSDGYYRAKEKRVMDIPGPPAAASEIADKVSRDFSLENRESLREVLAEILPKIIAPNLSLDRKLSEQFRKDAENSVPTVVRSYRKGDVLIRKNSVIDRDSLALYNAYVTEKRKIYEAEMLARKFVNYGLLCLFLMILNGIYLKHIHPEIFRSNKLMALTGTVMVLSIAANTVTIRIFEYTGGIFNLSPPLLMGAALPLALSSLILSVMIGFRVGLYAGFFVSIIAALQLGNSFNTIMTGMIVSAVSGFSVRHSPNHRAYFIRAALAVSFTMPLVESLNLWYADESLDVILSAAGLGFANGIVISAISLALIFVLETVFQMSTDMSLLVLCDYNHPLLKKLQFEAPGTYHHSLMVATLAEQAARDIGANPIQARACALFHDIGKVQMPSYFTENTTAGSDKHEDLNPKISTMVIQNHVKEGIKLAKKYKLRKVIRDAIEQHHGTDLVKFFFQRAKEENPDPETDVPESDFRYQGPLPSSKEVVIVSLADTCEAASRSLARPDPAKIEALISELFRKKIRDGQLDRAQITLGELGAIRKSFARTLSRMMHSRIAYPKDEDEDDLFKQAKAPAEAEDRDAP